MPDDQRPLDLRFTLRGEEYGLRLGLPGDEPAVEGGTEPVRDLILSALQSHPRGPHRLDAANWAEQMLTEELGGAVEVLEKGPGTPMDSDLPPGATP